MVFRAYKKPVCKFYHSLQVEAEVPPTPMPYISIAYCIPPNIIRNRLVNTKSTVDCTRFKSFSVEGQAN